VRAKLVKAVGETVVQALEIGFDIVVTLVTQGPAAAWDKIKEHLTNLKDMVIGGITDFVIDLVVKKAIPKLVAMFIPGAGFIAAILSIYDTVMVFVNKLAKIVQVITAFINSIVAIAAGQIGAAASKVEGILAGLLALAINFLAGFAGLGKVTDKVMGVINKVRGYIDKALDKLIGWIVMMAKKLFAKVFGKDKKDDRSDAEKKRDLDSGVREATALLHDAKASVDSVSRRLPAIKKKFKMTDLSLVVASSGATKQKVHVHGAINPDKDGPDEEKAKGMEPVTIDFPCKPTLLPKIDEFKRQLRDSQAVLSDMTIEQFISRRDTFFKRKAAAKAAGRKNPEGRDPEGTALQAAIRQKAVTALIAKLTNENEKLSFDDAKKKAEEMLQGKAAAHRLDQVAGGLGTDISDELADLQIDASIGAAWPKRAKDLEAKVKDLPDDAKKEKMKVTLTVNGQKL
jgi:hypothetical protein